VWNDETDECELPEFCPLLKDEITIKLKSA
jgi:hypothetical protein